MAITHKAMLTRVRDEQDGYLRGLQRHIDAGRWGLEGAIGRAMMSAIEAGECVLGDKSAQDYWGNRIPSRHEVLEGTKGSVTFAYRMRSREW